MIASLETDRLIMRPFEMEDADELFLLDSNPEVMKYLGKKLHSKVEESKSIIQMIQKQYSDLGIGRYAVIEKESSRLIGWSGLKLVEETTNGYNSFYDLGYRYLPEFWGKGYATEAAKAWLTHGFNDMGIDVIYANIFHLNKASDAVLRKVGFVKTDEFYEDDGLCWWYELKKENFNRKSE